MRAARTAARSAARLAVRLAVLTGVSASVVLAPTIAPAVAEPRPVPPRVVELPVDLPPQATGSRLEMAPLAADEFSMVGVVLPDDGSVAAEDLQLRVRTDAGWSPWQALSPTDAGPDAGTAEAERARRTTEPVWAPGSTGVQLRSTAGAERRAAARVRVALVDPGRSPADDGPGGRGAAHAATAQPRFVSRAQWGADESLRCDTVTYTSTIKAAVVHHTAGGNSYASAAEAMQQLRADYAYHTKVNGWCDLGYNFVVDKFGNAYEGRAGGVEKPVLGSHAGGFNTNTFGVAMLGDFSTYSPPAAMRRAVADVVAWKLSLYDRDPWGSTTLTSSGGGTARWPAGTTRTLPVVMGHRDVGSTACPGNAGYSILNGIRDLSQKDVENADFVQALYLDMLGRTPTWSELDGWTDAITRSGDRWVGARGFTGSEEYRRRSITGAYLRILGRDPDRAGLEGWLADVVAGRATLDDVPRRHMLSPEFYAQGGGTDEGFVSLLYRRLHGREASADEARGWADVVRRSGRAAAVNGIYDSYESALQRVDRSYRSWLGRPASAAERDYWAGTVLRVGDEHMRESNMVSPEYLARARARF